MDSHYYRWYFVAFYMFAWMIAMNILLSMVFDLVSLQFGVNKVRSEQGNDPHLARIAMKSSFIMETTE